MPDAIHAPLCGRRLLVVEDDYLVAIELTAALEERGAEIVGMVASVADAQALLEKERERIDGAILDVNLDGDRVYPVADTLLAYGIPFVFATGYDLWAIPDVYATVPRCTKPTRIGALVRLLTEQANGNSKR